MLNDPTWIEASRVLAEKTIVESADDSKRLRNMFQRVISQFPDAHELQLLTGLLNRQRQKYGADLAAAEALREIGAAAWDPKIEANELAAWTIVAQTILNHDEVVTRR